MVKRTALIRVVSLILLAACGALCQKRPSELSPGAALGVSTQTVIPEMRTWSSLPDAPSSVQPPRRTEKLPTFVFPTFVNDTGSPFTLDAVGISAGAIGHVTPGPQPSLTGHYQAKFVQKESGAFLGKYLYPPSLKQDARYYASASDSFMGRASYAASRIFVTRDDSGKTKLNTSYFLGILTSVASATAHRPYWARSTSETFNNFGSTIGGDAGMNVFHEFGPGIRQMVKGFTPKFVSRIAERITQDQTRDAVPAK